MKFKKVILSIGVATIMVSFVSCDQGRTTKKATTQETVYCPPGAYYCPPTGTTTTNPWVSTYPTPTPVPTSVPVPTFPTSQSDSCDNITGIDKNVEGDGLNKTPWCYLIKQHGGDNGAEDGWDTYHNYPAAYQDVFITDSTFKIKVTANSSPNDCETVDGKIYPKAYGQLKFDIGISMDGGNSFFYPKSDQYLAVGASKVYDLSGYINRNCAGSTFCKQFVRIQNIRSDHACTLTCSSGDDSSCQYLCPAEWKMPTHSCWGVRLQVSTDFHQDFAP